MANETICCPLCQGRSNLSRSELIDLLTDRDLRGKIERYLAELTQMSGACSTKSGTQEARTRDFQKEVHSWNPQVPMWNRSPKE